MALTTYTELKAAIADWIDRDDLTSQIPDFITLAEAEFNRVLLVPEREDDVTASVTGEKLLLPTDFYSVRSMYLNTDPRTLLEQMPLGELRNRWGWQSTGKPQNFAIQNGTELVFGPAPDTTYSVIMNYYKTITALSGSVASNWLLAAHPDIYLYGALCQAAQFMVDDARVPVWQQKHGLDMAQLIQAGHAKAWSGAPMRIRSPVVV